MRPSCCGYLQGDTFSISPGFSVHTSEIQHEKSHKNEKVTADFSVRIWEIQKEKSHKNEKVTLLTACCCWTRRP
eukprot:SAG31_NODE_512_length_14721_cov_17.995623_2_plen_74_part_00